jgi:CRISPR type I-E-associated protein CasB/Cse2
MAEKKIYPIDRFITAVNLWIEGDETNRNPKARGILADLRHGLSNSTQYRAWPHILSINNRAFDTPKSKIIWLTVAGGMAVLLDGANKNIGNMGATLREIAQGQGEEGLNSFASRFRRILSCRVPEEVCLQLAGVFRAAKQKSVSINFHLLFWDLTNWDNPERRVKVDWAIGYWGEDPGYGKGEAS